MSPTFFALALAAAVLDVTLGYPARLEAAIGSPSRWLKAWLRIVEGAAAGWEGRLALVVYLAPPFVAAAAVDLWLPDGPLGFALRALLISTLCGRQALDRRAREAARVWERDGAAEAWVAAEALSPQEDETRLAPSAAAALAARFADEVVAPTMFILIGGLVGATVLRALVVAGRAARRDTKLARAVAEVEGWTLAPCARLAALALAAASFRRTPFDAVLARAGRPTQPAEAAMLAALGPSRRDEPGYLRAALALYRRAAALELAALALLTLAAAFAL
jgi:adenosylcobinamide-phosphate synthase